MLNNSKLLQVLIIFPKIVWWGLRGRKEAAHELQMFMSNMICRPK